MLSETLDRLRSVSLSVTYPVGCLDVVAGLVEEVRAVLLRVLRRVLLQHPATQHNRQHRCCRGQSMSLSLPQKSNSLRM
jgi:hypothetical protein